MCVPIKGLRVQNVYREPSGLNLQKYLYKRQTEDISNENLENSHDFSIGSKVPKMSSRINIGVFPCLEPNSQHLTNIHRPILPPPPLEPSIDEFSVGFCVDDSKFSPDKGPVKPNLSPGGMMLLELLRKAYPGKGFRREKRQLLQTLFRPMIPFSPPALGPHHSSEEHRNAKVVVSSIDGLHRQPESCMLCTDYLPKCPRCKENEICAIASHRCAMCPTAICVPWRKIE
ncbi:uncharacterized protein VTP21DRAFT_3698 [Calcarisporiella thermophila]|uniref:uncharacterized protein n=1 Tax=Calcarisporiella thermophila TaxID=911321 RepID=UPI003743DECF